MTEELPNIKKFPVDGSEAGDPVYNTIEPLTTGSDAAPAVFLDELQDELDSTPPLLDYSNFAQIQKIRSGLTEYRRMHGEVSVPPHKLLDSKSVALGSFSAKKAEKLAEVTYKNIGEAIVDQIGKRELSKDDVIDLIFIQRQNIEAERISRTLIATALTNLVNNKILQEKNGFFSRVNVGVLGGSDLSKNLKSKKDPSQAENTESLPKEKPSVIERMNNFVDNVTDTVMENTAYGRLIKRIEVLAAQAPDAAKKTLNAFLHFRVHHKTMAEIIDALPAIETLVPNEYSGLVELAEKAVHSEKNEPAFVDEAPEIIVEPPLVYRTPTSSTSFVEPEPVVPSVAEFTGDLRTLETSQAEQNEKIVLLCGESTRASDGHPETNEDASFVDSLYGTIALFDGMGGNAGGEIASGIAKKFLQDNGVGKILQSNKTTDEIKASLSEVIKKINTDVYNDSFQNGKEIEGRMGTTASIAQIVQTEKGERLFVANAGDSRVYVIRVNGDLEQITMDDSGSNEILRREDRTEQEIKDFNLKVNNAIDATAFDNPENPVRAMVDKGVYLKRNQITKALGVGEDVEPNIYDVPIQEGDIILLTSDGVHDNLTEDEIKRYIREGKEQGFTAKEISDLLSTKAHERSVETSADGKKHYRAKSDDITAVIVGVGKSAFPRRKSGYEDINFDTLEEKYKADNPKGFTEATPQTEPILDETIISGEKPYPDGFVAEPPSIITPEALVLPLPVSTDLIDQNKAESGTEKVEIIEEEELRETLRVAREVFAKEESSYKQKIRADKKGYQKIMADLGVPGKQRELSLPTSDYLEAQKAYKDASRALKHFIAGWDIRKTEKISRKGEYSIIEHVKLGRIDVGVMEQEETERRFLKKIIEARMPAKERGIITKVFEKWSSYPLGARVALSATLLTLATGGVGTVGGTLAAITLRTTRSLIGVGGAMKAATAFDGIKRKIIEEKRKKAFEEYATISDENEEERENKLEKYLEAEEIQIKRDRVARAAIATVVGGITAAGTGMAMNATYDAIQTGGGAKINHEAQVRGKGGIPEGTKPKASWFDKLVKKDTVIDQPPALKVDITEKTIEATVQSTHVTPFEVDLSNKGFIDTVDKLKQASTEQSLTLALGKLFDQSPQKIAMDLGLYKPGQVAESAFGFKGEKLAIDAEGNVSLVHNSGATEVLMESKGTFKPFAGKMFDADNLAKSPEVVDSVPAPKVAEVIPPAPNGVAETVEKTSQKTSNVEIGPSVPKTELAADTATTTSALLESKSRSPLDFEQTVVRSPEYKGSVDMISGKLPLKAEYQFDPKWKPERNAYNIQLEKALMSMPHGTFDLRYPIEYNGGRINVFKKGNDILILLNGQKIGTGLMVEGEPGLRYERSLGTGIFGVKTDFEKAFEEASEGIMKNKMSFKKN